MSPNISLIRLTGSMMAIMLPVGLSAQDLLRLVFGGSVNQRPERWDQTIVPQMGGLFNITLPGRIPDYEWKDAPKMEYDPHPDKHFRR